MIPMPARFSGGVAPVGKKKPPRDLSDGGENGANRGDRTHDLRITNALLYQLSYVGKTDGKIAFSGI